MGAPQLAPLVATVLPNRDALQGALWLAQSARWQITLQYMTVLQPLHVNDAVASHTAQGRAFFESESESLISTP